MKENYLLHSSRAIRLYSECADLSIIDFHNHLSLPAIKDNAKFENITKLWIEPDPYKHRLMRVCGVDEHLITGDGSDREKFNAWCEIFPTLMGTPVFDWSLCELKTIFTTDIFPCRENSDLLWGEISEKLSDINFAPLSLLEKFNVEYAAPCAGITDDITFLESIENIVPSLRGDDILRPDVSLIEKLSNVTGIKILTPQNYFRAISKRLKDFKRAGCRFADHALDNGFTYFEDDEKNEERFTALLNKGISEEDEKKLFSFLLTKLGVIYSENSFVMQLHIGALRHTSTRLRGIAGMAGGYAGIGGVNISSITKLFDNIEKEATALPKTILFTLNPAYNAAISVLCGSYSKNNTPSILSQGPAWWWCDHIKGMREVFEDFSSYGVIYHYPGMTTDSRSFLSFVRHDYFRRVFCNWVSEKVERQEFPDRYSDLKELVERVSYKNAKEMIKQ